MEVIYNPSTQHLPMQTHCPRWRRPTTDILIVIIYYKTAKRSESLPPYSEHSVKLTNQCPQETMDTTKKFIFLFAQVLLVVCVTGIPRVVSQINHRNAGAHWFSLYLIYSQMQQNVRGNPTATVQMHSSSFSEESFIDYEPSASIISKERPNVCNNCGK